MLRASGLEEHAFLNMPELHYIERLVPGPGSEKLLYFTHRYTGDYPVLSNGTLSKTALAFIAECRLKV